MDARQKLEKILVEKLKLEIDVSAIKDDQPIQELGMDSLVLVRLIYLLEDDYRVTLSTSEVLSIGTFGDLVRLLDQKLGASEVAAA